MRRAFEEVLVDLAETDDRIIFLTGDLGFQVFDRFEQKFGPRYVNIGVAEAQLMNAAAGLAADGWRPLAYSIASFATARPFEQIRISICYPNLAVIVVGAGGGFTYASSGVTHHAADDLSLMTALPNMTVVAPGCPDELRQLMPQLFLLDGPSYLRIGKFGEPDYHSSEKSKLGKARRLRDGQKVAIVSTGDLAVEVMTAHKELEKENIHPIVYQFHTVKPLDKATLDEICHQVSTIIVVEEQIPSGGLFAGICQWRAAKNTAPRLVRLGAPDQFVLGNPDRNELRRRIGVDSETIKIKCKQAWTDSGVVISSKGVGA